MQNPVFFFPNIVDYTRILLLFMAIFTYNEYSDLTVNILAISDILDAFDGYLARKFN